MVCGMVSVQFTTIFFHLNCSKAHYNVEDRWALCISESHVPQLFVAALSTEVNVLWASWMSCTDFSLLLLSIRWYLLNVDDCLCKRSFSSDAWGWCSDLHCPSSSSPSPSSPETRLVFSPPTQFHELNPKHVSGTHISIVRGNHGKRKNHRAEPETVFADAIELPMHLPVNSVYISNEGKSWLISSRSHCSPLLLESFCKCDLRIL